MITTETIYVNGRKKPCQGFIPQQCYQVKYSLNAPWENFYDEIIGFNFEPGYIYKLIIREEDKPVILMEGEEEDPDILMDVMDVSSATYTLVRVLEKTPMSFGRRCCNPCNNPCS